MKLNLFFIAGCMLLLTPLPVEAQLPNEVMVVRFVVGGEYPIPLDHVRNISFEDGDRMTISMLDYQDSFFISDVQNLVFTTSPILHRPDVEVNPGLNIYPNPVIDLLTVKYVQADDLPVLVQIYDLNGRLVLLRSATADEASSGLSFPAGQLSPGLYLVRLQAGTQIFSSKFIK